MDVEPEGNSVSMRTIDDGACQAGSETVSDRRRRLVILVQYDPQGGLPAFVRIHLERLRPLATQLVLVSNSPLSAEARQASDRICDSVILRDNIGWDFAGWRDALACENMAAWDSVILTNSSVVGPLFPLKPIVERMEGTGNDFWGMVHLRLHRPHLQSYFLSFTSEVIRSEAWQTFWRSVEDLDKKNLVIRRYELSLTRSLEKAGFSFSAFSESLPVPSAIRLVHVNRLKRKVRIPWNVNYVNRTVEMHEELIREGMPYLKASLLWGKDTYRMKPISQIKAIPGVNYPWKEIGL